MNISLLTIEALESDGWIWLKIAEKFFEIKLVLQISYGLGFSEHLEKPKNDFYTASDHALANRTIECSKA